LRARNLRAERKRDEKIRACAPNFITIARAARLCVPQNIFAQFAAHEGVEGVESIKNERISAK